MKIEITKPPIPMLWLDTWAIYRLAKALKTDKSSLKDKKWAQSIFEKITTLTDKGKIICPEADQGIEIETGGVLVKESNELQIQLSRGVRTHYYKTVEERQIQKVMTAFVKRQAKASLPWNDLFFGDPLKKIGKKDPFIISVRFNQPKTELEKRKRVNRSIAKDWERIRKKSRRNKEKFQERLVLESGGYAGAVANLFNYIVKKKLSGEKLTPADIRKFTNVCGIPLAWWHRLTDEDDNKGVKGLLSFYLSDTFKKIPAVDVHSRLVAKLITDDEVIKPSDVMDVNQITAIMPYAHYMITDGAMRDKLVYKLKLHDKYGTKIIKIGELESLLKKF